MQCTSCGRESRPGARFCSGCGATLAAVCPACGAETEPDGRFCDACGAALAQPATSALRSSRLAATATRKVVTIVFADLIGSTALHERLDAEPARLLMDDYYRALEAAIESHGGTLVKLLGDGVMAAFGVPRVAEDDAIRAVRAGVAMQRAFRALVEAQRDLVGDLGLRVGINTGEVVVSADHADVIGDPVNVAARLQEEARDGDVVIGDSTQRLVAERVTLAPFGTFALKGRAEPVAAFRVVSLERPAGAAAVAFVGRDDELRRLSSVYDAAVAGPAARLAVVLGSPGLGKSRLLAEFALRLGERATVLTAQCHAAGGATFAPLAEALRAQLGVETGADPSALRAAVEAATLALDAPERTRIAAGVGALLAGTPASPEETFFVVRRLLAALAIERPVVLAIDDLQWAEPLLLDLTEHLVQWGAGVPLLVLAAARPELRDMRSSLASLGGAVSDVLTLGGLDAGAATRLAASVLGADALPAAVAGRVLATSEGNPLFLGELVRMLVQDGALRREGERWTTAVDLADLQMPPTIQALLAARIERLRPEDRLVLERASVVGRHFSRAAVVHLLPADAHVDLDARLESLRRSELVEPDTGWLLGEPLLRFHHVLIRDAAYRRLLRNTRAELHERFAEWLVARAGESVEHDETIGWHLEQAHQHLRELGPLDDRGRALGERAARYLALAGRRALGRDDLLPAAGLLGRALERLGAEDASRADLVLDWCEALLSAGDVTTGSRAIAELARLTADSERLRAWHACFTGQLAVLTDPKALRASEGAVAAAAETLTAAGDASGEAKAHSIHALVLAQLGKIGACEAALDRALAAARRSARDRRRANAVLAGAPLAALWGPSPVTRASGRCLDVVRVLRITQGAPAVEAVALRCQAVLETLRGRGEAARRMIASSRHLVEELGITQRVLEADLFAGLIELLEGDAAAAERWLRSAWDGLREQGLGIDAAQAGALLARALLAQGRVAEADDVSLESESLAGDSFKAAIAWRGVRAEVLAARGESAAAVDLARAAVEIAAATDDLLDHADARASLAVALRAAGRSAEADAEERRAIELWEAKGASLLVERARRSPSASAPAESAPIAAAESRRTNRPRVERNYATAHLARLDEAVAARDMQAVARVLGDARLEDHVHGDVFGSDTLLERFRWLIEGSADLTFHNEPIAVLGPSLALARWRETGSGVSTGELAVGSYEVGGTVIIEADSDARLLRIEAFAPGKLGDAIARLYERYAELLPEGPERTRAAGTARSIAAVLGPFELDRRATAFAPAIEFFDHRLAGVGPLTGAQRVLEWLGSLLEVADDIAYRTDDILALHADAALIRWMNFGTDRASGGRYERHNLWLGVFGADGLVTRIELFDTDREAEALARFDELTARATPPRRVRANAATANAARVDAAFRARDAGAFAALVSERAEWLHHPTGTVHDGAGILATSHAMLGAESIEYTSEPLATLGESLALCRRTIWTVGGLAGGEPLPFGEAESANVALIEVDALGRRQRVEIFATDHLSDAVVRLYERYAELLPDGPERKRAAGTARSIAAVLGPFELDRRATAFAPAIEFVDHRLEGVGALTGAQSVLEWLGSLLEVADDVVYRTDDILALHAGAALLRWMNFGMDRASGGRYERHNLWLGVFGADGLVTRIEVFDVDRHAEALARFDELTTPRAAPTRRVRANAATANAARVDAAFRARDADAFAALVSERAEWLHHPTGTVHDGAGILATWHAMLGAEAIEYTSEPLATLGESLALCRRTIWTVGGLAGGEPLPFGEAESANVALIEVDARGRRQRVEIFDSERLGDAVVRLYERYAELLPDGPERTRAAATACSVAVLPVAGAFEVDAYIAVFAPEIEAIDMRTVGFGFARGAEEFGGIVRAFRELVDDPEGRIEDVLALRADALLVRWTNSGRVGGGGGSFERTLLLLWAFGVDGRLTRWEHWDIDRHAEALARFDELATPRAAPTRRVRPNAATAHLARLCAAVAARDAAALSPLIRDDLEVVHHRTHSIYGREEELRGWRALIQEPDGTLAIEPLATLGDALALCHQRASASGTAGSKFDFGAYEIENVLLAEVDAEGRQRRGEYFAADRLGDAVVRLYERYAELLPEGSERERAAATTRSVATMMQPPDLQDRYASALAPTVELVDHRRLGTWSARGAGAMLQHLRSLLELSSDVAVRVHGILALDLHGYLVRWTTSGTDRASGGAYERDFLMLCVYGADGLLTRCENFDSGGDAEALARFDELAAPRRAPRAARRVRPNAATVNADRQMAAIAAGDASALPALATDDVEVEHHPSHSVYGREEWLRALRSFTQARGGMLSIEPLATLGESLAVCRSSFSASGTRGRNFDVGPIEYEDIALLDVDDRGRCRHTEIFAPDRLGDAVVRLYERHAELLPEGPECERAAATARSVATLVGPHYAAQHATTLAPDVERIDHRSTGLAPLRGRAAVEQGFRALADLSESFEMRVDDVLAVRADALLVRMTNAGTLRDGGGSYERNFLMLQLYGVDGLVVRRELFELDRDADALARLDELVPQPQPVTRRVRPNAVTESAARIVAAVRARDVEALPGLFSDDFEAVDHSTGATYGRDGGVATGRMTIEDRDLVFRQDPLATLGPRLALLHNAVSSSGALRGAMDVGPFETDSIVVAEVDEHGRRRRNEWFRTDRLDDAVVRLYERYAELLPEGPERERAAATARTLAVVLLYESDRFFSAFAPAIESVDHRMLGTFSAQGAEAVLAAFLSWEQVATDIRPRIEEILALESAALVLHRTLAGTDRVSGGAFERSFLVILVFGPDGLLTRWEPFDIGREAEALARFDALVTTPRTAARRVRPNAATANAARTGAVLAAGDADAFASLFGDDFDHIDHKTGAQYGRDGAIATLRMTLEWRDLRFEQEPIASLGNRLALCRTHQSGSSVVRGEMDVGPVDVEVLTLIEVDSLGRRRRNEAFRPEQLGDAIARLYERYAELLPEGTERERAAATARSVAAMLQQPGLERWGPVFAPDIQWVDSRNVGTGPIHGSAALQESIGALIELTNELRYRIEDVLAARPGALLVRWTNFGTLRASGGAYERDLCQLWLFAADGRLARWEQFDAENAGAALARFDELTSEPAPPRFENAATRLLDAFIRSWNARDWEGVVGAFSPAVRIIERRSIVRLDLVGNDVLANFRIIFDMGASRWRSEFLGTRGERLALFRWRLELESAYEAVGPSVVEWLGVVEVDASGRSVGGVTFDLAALGAAYAELDARYDAGEGAAFVRGRVELLRPFHARDWDGVAALLAPDFVLVDHRPLGWGSLDGPTYVESLKALVELSPDARLRCDHEWRCERGALGVFLLFGTREGGAFEESSAVVFERDARGRQARQDHYTLDQLDAARARFAELSPAASAPPRIENAATRWLDRFLAAVKARDWETIAAGYALDHRHVDRRPLLQLELDHDQNLEWLRIAFEQGFRSSAELLATRGDRLALVRARSVESDELVGPSENVFLAIVEVDERGGCVAEVFFDLDRLDAAYAELDARYVAGEAAPYVGTATILHRYGQAVAARDWEHLASALAPDFAIEDHRKPGLFSAISRDEFVASVRSLVELRPDAMLRGDHVLALGDRRSLVVARWVGGESDATFEIPFVNVAEYGAGAFRRWHVYDLDDLDAARAHYDALGASAPRDPLAALVKPNAATAALDRFEASYAARDWAAVRALAAEGARFEDRRGHALLSLDADAWVADFERAAAGAAYSHYQRTLVATAGDRIALEHVLWNGGPPDGRVELEFLWLAEVDERGRLVGSVLFDAGDRRAALQEGFARLLAGNPEAAALLAPLVGSFEAWNDHDLVRVRAYHADDLVVHDHRHVGVGEIAGAEAFVASFAPLWELAPDIQFEPRALLALERHGFVFASRQLATLSAGGAFEKFLVQVMIIAGGRIARVDVFEPEAVDAALARFAELRPDPLRIPPNAATRARDRQQLAREARDWDAFAAMFAPDLLFDDRRRGVRLTGDRELFLASSRHMASTRVSRTLLATAGEHLALERNCWHGAPGDPAFEVEALTIWEVDEHGAIIAAVMFDPGDRRAAAREMLDRHARMDPAHAGMFELGRAILDRDLERCRAAIPADFVSHDHRRSGAGRSEGADAWIAWFTSLLEQSPDAISEPLYYVASGAHADLAVAHSFGTLAQGGEFESVYLTLWLYRDGQPVALEVFEPEDLDRARARFAELCASSA